MLRAISNSKYSKLMSSFLAFIIFFNNIIFPTQAFALTGGPSQPEFSSFDPAGSSEMVNLFTGDFSYNIPLMDVDGYPVNIAYHAAPSMDQDASWVGLGWNVNAGAINRGMRGLPDDFNGDPLHRDLNIEPYKAWGVSVGYFGEFVGLKVPINVSGSAGVGVFHSNYSGFGIEMANSNTFGVSAGKNMQGGLTAGLGVKLSSQDGMDIYPSLGVSAKMEGSKRTNSLGVNIGCSINSRDGLKSINGGFSVSSQKTGKATDRKGLDNQKPVSNKGGKGGVGLGFGSSASIPASSQGFMPKMIANMSSQAYSLDFKLGANGCVYAQGGYISGYYAQNGINDSQKNKDYSAFGYLFSQNASDDDMLDFNREKDGMMYPELPNMPIANYTFDMFSASAQGLNYAFRPHRNDIGALRDNSTIDNSFALGLGAEIMVSSDVNVGININVMFSDGEAGKWTEDNDFNIYSEFTHSTMGSDYEASYFKVAGEKTDDDVLFLSYISDISSSNDEPYRVKLNKKTNTTYFANNELLDKYGNNPTTSLTGGGSAQKTKRAKRNQLVSYLNGFEASKFGLEKRIKDYPEMTPSKFTTANFDNIVIKTTSSSPTDILGEYVPSFAGEIDRDGTFNGGRSHHISEMSITQDNGSRYVYGIPMYNRKQTEAMFNIDKTYEASTNASFNNGIVNIINQSEIGIGGNNPNGVDHFMEKTTLNDYSHGFLLTSILSSDYVDRTSNGPSNDDYGDYTKFNYSKINYDKSDAYKWRIPVSGAKYGQGLLADRKDNKGAYVYGEKDLWYTQSIETKNYVAFFVLNDKDSDPRLDAFPVSGELGGIAGTNPSRKLKEIRLYAKKDFIHGGIANAKPIKVVHFEYDYSLCHGTPNSTANGQGKLTLKKIWFTYGNSEKGKSSPYIFDYADINHDGNIDSNENPNYNSASIDRWGSFKPNSIGTANLNFGNNMDFPYVNQAEPTTDLNNQSAAWSLTQIKTPAGSSIKVNYEADDYAFIQDNPAGQMFKVLGLNNAPSVPSSSPDLLYGNEYVIVDLSSSGQGGGIINSGSQASIDAEFNSKYIKGLKQMYFKFKVNLDNAGNYEFVPGYGEVDGAGICMNGGTYQINGTGPSYYKYGYVKLKLLGLKDDNSGSPSVNPIVKAAMQMGRMSLPQIVFPGSAPASGNGNAIKGLVTTLKDARYFLEGVNKALYERNIAKTCEPAESIVRLYNPNGFKKGGGTRVSRITINDNWNSMSGEASAEYGQEYSYTTQVGGKSISSGVASYEPLQGGDENSMRYPIDFSIKKTFAPNDEYFQEEPMGESFFPDPLVGYSKITVKNISKPSVTAHATGRTEYEFFTAKDYPVVTDRTDMQKQRVKPNLLLSILKFGSTDKLYLSQGYLIKTNDMHGKMKSQKMFAEGAGANDAISGIIYHYKSKNGTKCQELDNTVPVIDKNNTISDKTIGKTTDFYTDSRSSVNDVYTAGVSINIQSATCTYYVPLVFVWPSFGYEHREFKSLGTTKLIQQYGLIDYVEAFENSSTVVTKNLLYDDITGDVILTETTNDFDKPVYNLKYAGYWAYEDMGAAFVNAGVKFNPILSISNTGQILPSYKQYFRPGDEVAVFDISGGNFVKTWVAENKVAGNSYHLLDRDGNIYAPPATLFDPTAPNHLKILRSGRRNMQSAPMASLLSLANPINSSSNKIDVSQTTKVINSSAVEYDENWHLLVGDKKGQSDCNCTPTQAFSDLSSAITAIISSQWHNSSQPIKVWDFIYQFPGPTFINPNLQGLLQSFPWYNGCNTHPPFPPLNRAIYMNITKSIVSNGSGFDHMLTIVFNANGVPGCNGTSCPIQLVIKSNNNSVNAWDNVTGINNIVLIPSADCQPSTQFNFCVSSVASSSGSGGSGGSGSGGSSSGVSRLSNAEFLIPPVTCTNNIGSSCYVLTSCTNNNTVVQCGNIVGDIINPYVENIRGNWRVKKSYSYLTDRTQTSQAALNMNGDISKDGIYNTFNPFWNYTTSWKPIYQYQSGFDKWIKNNEVDKINEYGNVLIARDVLNRPSASLYGYNHTLPLAAANNAYYNQLAFDGFEDYNFINNECSASLLGSTPTTNSSGYIEHFNYYAYKTQLTSNESHTGRFSMPVFANTSISVTRKLTNFNPTGPADDVPYTIKAKDNYGLFGPFYSFAKPQSFVLSVWAKENYNTNVSTITPIIDYSHVGVSVSVNGVLLTSSAPKKSAIINGWQKLEYEFTVSANTPNSYGASPFGTITVSLNNSGSNPVFYDDIRIHPFSSSMKSMVYDPYSLRLMAELDDRNFATLYEYDEEGTLVRVKKETEKGIFTIKESRSGLKK